MVNGTHKSLKGFRKFVKNKAQSIRRSRQGKFNTKPGASVLEDGKYNTIHQEQILSLF